LRRRSCGDLVGRLAGHLQEQLLEARRLGNERRDRNPRLPEGNRKGARGAFVRAEAQLAVVRDETLDSRQREQQRARAFGLRRPQPVPACRTGEKVSERPL